MEELRFDIQYPGGRTERSVVQSARVVIGSGAHCDVRLAPDQAAFEHVVVEMLPEGTRLTRVAKEMASLDGNAFSITTLGPCGTVVLGQTVVRIERAAVAVAAANGKLGAGVLLKGVVLAMLLGAVLVISNMPEEGVGRAPADLPELFPAQEITCARTDPAEAAALASDTHAIADGARERSPFEPREAVAAVKAYDLAAACYTLAGDPEAAAETSRTARELEAATRGELRARRVRLERMLAVKDYEIARQDVVVLRALLEGQRGPYVSWLAKVAQELKSRRAGKG
ncbi:MAG: hypothetical protein BGO98_27325 [Myxococcales bacterium 68-20]|nr:MAG: hypothetical protein BGO98_27325 [Myxococcales bacterium 68-20]